MSAKTCEHCGKAFERPGMSPNKFAGMRFCCRTCADLARRGKPSSRPLVNGVECMIDGCTDMARCRRMCNTHYRAWIRWGDPLHKGTPGRKKPQPEPTKRKRFVVVRSWEPVVIIGPDSTPVTCPDCGVIYSATDDPILAACALDNHQRFHKEEAAA